MPHDYGILNRHNYMAGLHAVFTKGLVEHLGVTGTPTLDELLPATTPRTKIAHIIIRNPAGARVYQIVDAANTVEYMRVSLPALDNIVLPSFDLPAGGLAVIGSSAAAAATITVLYVKMGEV